MSLAKKLLQRLGKNEIEQSIGKMALRFETVFANNRALQRDVADKTIRADCLEEEEKALRKEHRQRRKDAKTSARNAAELSARMAAAERANQLAEKERNERKRAAAAAAAARGEA